MSCVNLLIPVQGDLAVKEIGVISTPDIQEYSITPRDKFFIMASDGVWEFISNEVICKLSISIILLYFYTFYTQYFALLIQH